MSVLRKIPHAPPMARGGAPVGVLADLPPVERAAVVCLRAWCQGGADRARIAQDFALLLGDASGAQAAEDFDALMRVIAGHARRPVMRHALGCRCIGGDESAFANLIAAAAGQDREDALLFASTLMPGPPAWTATCLAEALGQVFLRLARMPADIRAPTHPADPDATKH